jgi:lysophospholipase L1-like esterase
MCVPAIKAKGQNGRGSFTAAPVGASVSHFQQGSFAMTKTLLTFGDSNTHGSPPMVDRDTYRRFGSADRWPTVAHAALGPGWHLVEEGLPGRTAQFSDPLMGPHMNGQSGLRIALESHGPLDVLTIMLGTNDVKTIFGATPEMVAAGIAGLLAIALSDDMQTRHGGMKVLLICPPPVLEQGPIVDVFFSARAKSQALPPLYSALAAHWGAGFFDAGEAISVSPTDGVHFEAAAHRTLGAAIATAIRSL